MHRRHSLALIAAAALAAIPVTGFAQPWPSRPLTYVVPFTSGGSTDIVGRTLAQHLSTSFGRAPG